MAKIETSSSVSNLAHRRSTIIVLIIVAMLAALLGIYQWIELVQLRTGSGTPLCSLSASFDCAKVWNAPLGDTVHQGTGLPIAGWGLAWGLVVFMLAVSLLWQSHQTQARSAGQSYIISALRLTVGIGALVCLLLLAYSVTLKVFCPTCIVFYVLVAIVTYIAFLSLRARNAAPLTPPNTVAKEWAQPALLSGGLLLVTFAVLLYPGLHTPRENMATARVSALINDETLAAQAASTAPTNAPPASVTPANNLEKFLTSLPQEAQQAVSDSLAIYRKSPFIPASVDSRRLVYGSSGAPVHIVEWSEIRCPHCKNLNTALTEVRTLTPANSWSQESRHFPLYNECNPSIQRSGGEVSCLAAKLEICLAGSPDYSRVRSTMFQEQENLTTERIWQIAPQDAQRRNSLEECVSSAQTAAILQEDINYADKHQISGTPLVIINGRRATAVPAFIVALIMAQGRDDDPSFLALPPPNPQIQP